jgi:hypothetical protein
MILAITGSSRLPSSSQGRRKAQKFYPGWWQRPGHARAPGFDHRAGLARRILNEEFSVSSPRLWCLRASLIGWPGPVMNTVMLGGGGAGRGSSSPRSPEVPVKKGTTTQR